MLPLSSSQGIDNMYPRGSEWRRWDLHVHTPDTALNDEFGSWEEYVESLSSQGEVCAVGVTDYLSISNYSYLKRLKSEGRIANIDLLIPNIEFRIAPRTARSKAINIHLLVSPEQPDHETKILEALGRLDWVYAGHRYSCLPDQLRALGRAHDANARTDKAAFQVGVSQFKVDFSEFRQWLSEELWLKRNSIVVVSAGEDGLSGLQHDSGWAATRDEIERLADAIFCGLSRRAGVLARQIRGGESRHA